MSAKSKSILVVEDETLIRRFICTILRDQGFRALPAANGSQAAQIWNQESGAIDVVVLDCMLPDGNGMEMAQQFTASRPDLKIIFMSGMEQSWIGSQPASSSVFLSKPFDASAMHAALARIFPATGDAPHPIASHSSAI